MIMKVEPTIIDIRKVDTSESICDQVVRGLSTEPRTLPALLFYSTEGIQHWNHHSHQPDFYPRQEETRILRDHAHSIATTLAHNSVIVDLGSASLDKVLLLLEALEAQQKPVRYYALDLSATELATALSSLPTARFRYVRCAALHGTFDDGLRWLRETPDIRDQVHHLLLFGLTLGNYSRANAAAFLRQLTNQALSTRQAESSILVTLDNCKVPTRVLRAYTSEGVVPFALASLDYANRLLLGGGEGEEKGAIQAQTQNAFDPKDWNYLSEWNYVLGRHEASLIPQAGDVSLGPPLGGITVRREEKVRFGCSYKYDREELETLWEGAGVDTVNAWSSPGCEVHFYQLKMRNPGGL
ncbi:hypothetical protein LT330_005248 [Penicillium expansum]|nr:hypothetical protein LT330_005248 [Penicillium expansum]